MITASGVGLAAVVRLAAIVAGVRLACRLLRLFRLVSVGVCFPVVLAGGRAFRPPVASTAWLPVRVAVFRPLVACVVVRGRQSIVVELGFRSLFTELRSWVFFPTIAAA